jgi:hypothetical protein
MARAEIFYGYSWESPEEFGFTADDFYALYAWEEEQIAKILIASGHDPDPELRTSEWRALERAAEEQLGASMSTHGGDDDTIVCPHLLASTAPHWWVHDYGRGDPIELSTLREIDPAWKPALDRYLAAHGIQPPQGENQPGWWVVANAHI